MRQKLRRSKSKRQVIGIKHFLILLFVSLMGSYALAQTAESQVSPVYVLDVKGVINPFTAKYIYRGIDQAERDGAQLIIIQMDTPGGLDTSMRDIDSAILNADLPVAVFVGPKGARAASAGVFITYASDIAAMSPGTNIGAAHFVELAGGDESEKDNDWAKKILDLYEESQKRKQASEKNPELTPGTPENAQPDSQTRPLTETPAQPGSSSENDIKSQHKNQREVMAEKITNDAVAYIQAIADIHGRNRDWAEKAVRESVSITADEALKQNVIEYMAVSIEDLITQLEGKTIIKGEDEYLIQAAGAPVMHIPMSAIESLFLLITNPQIAYFLLMIGIYGLIYEVTHPGAIAPGVLGGISLVLAILALNMLPITTVGVVLLLLGIGFMVAEIKVPGVGLLAVGGIICFILGSFLLIDRNYGELVIKPETYLPMAAFTVLLFVIILPRVYKALRGKVIATGEQGLMLMVGTVVSDLSPKGKIYVHGEYWNAVSNDGSTISKDEKVVVVRKDQDAMTLIVKRKSPD
jgi:membrane-bound serine protease (ClpP class)